MYKYSYVYIYSINIYKHTNLITCMLRTMSAPMHEWLFQGPTAPGPGSLNSAALHVFIVFFIIFVGIQKWSLRPPQWSTKSVKITKNRVPEASLRAPSKKSPKMMQFKRAKPLNWLTVTHFQLFFQWPKASKTDFKSFPKWTF